MKCKEFAIATGLPLRTVRYLTLLGIISTSSGPLPGTGKHHKYHASDVIKGHLIAKLLTAGFTVAGALAFFSAMKRKPDYFAADLGDVTIIIRDAR